MTRSTPKRSVTFRAPFVRCEAPGHVFLSAQSAGTDCARPRVLVRHPVAVPGPGA